MRIGSKYILYQVILSLLPSLGLSQVNLDVERIPGLDYYNEHEFATIYASMSPAGDRLILTRTNGGLYEIEFVEFIKEDSLWIGPKGLNLINQAQGNLYWSSVVSFTKDGNRIYYSSEYQDAYGSQDVYYSDLINGVWQPPVNVGKPLNSENSESHAWISPEETRMYFSSTHGPEDEGEIRIYYSEKQKDEIWGNTNQWFPNLNFKHVERPVAFRENALLINGLVGKKDEHYSYLSVLRDETTWTVPIQITFNAKQLKEFEGTDDIPRQVTTTESFEYLYLINNGRVYRSKVTEELKAITDNAYVKKSLDSQTILASDLNRSNETLLVPSTSSENRVALVIGNGNYLNGGLKNPINDAKLMASELEKAGFRVFINTDSDLVTMKESIREFGNELKRNPGVGLFYYAGHGLQNKGVNYLVPVNADIQHAYDIEDECMRADRVLRMMELYQNPLNIVILDACRNNPYTSDFRSMDRGLAQPQTAPTGSIIAFATAPGKTASDGEGSNGLYTNELVKAMRVPGLTIEEIFKRARINVAELTGDQQIPWENSSLFGDFYFYK
jgi:hypothetical protein